MVQMSVSNSLDFSYLYNKIKKRDGLTKYIAQLVLDSGWDFIDYRPENRGRFQRDPSDSKKFFDDLNVDGYYLDELSDRQLGLLEGLFNGWRFWMRSVRKVEDTPLPRSKKRKNKYQYKHSSHTVIVSFDDPGNCNPSEMMDYIKEVLESEDAHVPLQNVVVQKYIPR